jgi:hypothetical protein
MGILGGCFGGCLACNLALLSAKPCKAHIGCMYCIYYAYTALCNAVRHAAKVSFSDYESVGREFESLRAHHSNKRKQEIKEARREDSQSGFLVWVVLGSQEGADEIAAEWVMTACPRLQDTRRSRRLSAPTRQCRFATAIFRQGASKLEEQHFTPESKAQTGMFRVSPKLESFFRTPVPEKLWHYTSVSAFEKILLSGEFWATEARFTNDPTEHIYLLEVVNQFLDAVEPRLASVGLDKRVVMELMKIHYNNGVLSPGFAEVFIASFSTAEDLRSQWAIYGGQPYRGVSIAFDLRHVRPPDTLDSSITLAPCVYRKDEQEELILEPLNCFLKPFEELQKRNEQNCAIARARPFVRSIRPEAGEPLGKVPSAAQIRDSLVQASKDMSRDLFVLASQFKNPMFEEEHEWRLVLPRSKKKDSPRAPVQFREGFWSGEAVEIPYIAWELRAAGTDRLPIVEVIAGPHCETGRVEGILKTHGYNVPITRSQVPVR